MLLSAAPSLPPCGNYVGQEYLVSVSGRCILPDGEIMAGGIWAPRHPGQSVTYVVNWTTGGDNSQVSCLVIRVRRHRPQRLLRWALAKSKEFQRLRSERFRGYWFSVRVSGLTQLRIKCWLYCTWAAWG